MLVVPREVSGVPMAATRALIKRGIRRLHLVALPTSSMQADLMIGAGCVETLETSAVSLGEFGPAPRFTAAIKARTINTGQSCIAAKRFVIADKIYDEFLDQFVARMRALKIGDPMDETTEIGPLATEQILHGVHDQVVPFAMGERLFALANQPKRIVRFLDGGHEDLDANGALHAVARFLAGDLD